jgi:hypothetical protein
MISLAFYFFFLIFPSFLSFFRVLGRLRPLGEFESPDLLVAAEVVNEVGQVNVRHGTLKTNGAQVRAVHAIFDKSKDVFDAHACL